MSKYVQNPSSVSRLVMQAGRLELAPGEIRLLTAEQMSHPHVVYAIEAGQVKVLEDLAKALPITTPPPATPASDPWGDGSMTPEEYARFLESKQNSVGAVSVPNEQAPVVESAQPETPVVSAGSDQGDTKAVVSEAPVETPAEPVVKTRKKRAVAEASADTPADPAVE
jgi:hypothetical protein